MIAFLSGQLRFKSPEYSIIDVQGVGYQVVLPLSSFYELPPLKEEIHLHIYTHVREDALSLFGFLTLLEKKLFLLLLGVTGIGAKLALNILSGISAPELYQALATADSQRVQRVPGVGKKTSERIILELKDRVKRLSWRPRRRLKRELGTGPGKMPFRPCSTWAMVVPWPKRSWNPSAGIRTPE